MSADQIYQNIETAIITPQAAEIPVERSATDSIAFAVATCGGVGYAPIVPATFGSLAAVGIYLLAQKAGGSFYIWAERNYFVNALLLESFRLSFTLIFLLAIFLIGIWAASRVEKMTGKKDPRIVVIDEVVGQFIALLFIPANSGWLIFAAGFVAFRVFDIWKPFPTDKMESLPSGLGIMADDVMAGFYAAAFLSVLILLSHTVL
jgi:phosphatidylglycerophosphatase A